MKIEDFLKQSKFKELDLFLTAEMKRLAGKRLIKKMLEALKDEESARDWFYSPIFPLEGKRPYDYCVEGKIKEIENELERIEYGVF